MVSSRGDPESIWWAERVQGDISSSGSLNGHENAYRSTMCSIGRVYTVSLLRPARAVVESLEMGNLSICCNYFVL